jgi:hypothetical protein
MLRSTLILALVAALAVPSLASEQIKLKGGKVVSGRATAYDPDRKVLSFRLDDGQEMQYSMDDLDSRSVYLVYGSVIPKENGKGQLQLANFARDAGLYQHAVRRYGYAAKADPSLKAEVDKGMAELKKRAAAACLANAKAAQAKGNAKETQKWLNILLERLPDEPQAVEAAAMVEANYTREANARDDALEKEHAELIEKDLKKGKKAYDTMIEKTKQGLTARNSSESSNHWNSALREGETVLKEIDRLEKKYPDDKRIQDGAVKYRKLTIDQMVSIHLHLASRYTANSSLSNAMKEANKALALDPENAQALAARARIEVAANDGGLINW